MYQFVLTFKTAVSPFLTVTIRDGAEKYGDAAQRIRDINNGMNITLYTYLFCLLNLIRTKQALCQMEYKCKVKRKQCQCQRQQQYTNRAHQSVLTIDLQLNYFADARTDAVVRLTKIEAFTVFFNILQQQRAIW